ncbi:MAG: pilus assembly protein PilM [Deltaproteobacteria bacterium]|nr:pilus assembly protein PilM [Deltaproteobacteria bacterium]
MFAVDLGAWSVKLAIASPGLRGATLLDVVERQVPPGDEPAETRARQTLAAMISELRLQHDTGYIGVYGDQVFTQILEFGFKNLRRAELDKAVGGELEGVVPVDLEDMVYTFEPLPPVPAPAPGTVDAGRGRVAPATEGMRVLTYAMHRDRAEEMIALGRQAGFEVRGVLACGGAAVRLVERTPSLVRARTEGAVAVIDIGHERTDVIVVAQGKVVFSRSIARAGKQVTEAIAREFRSQLPSWADAERAKHSDGFVASTAEPATSESWARIHRSTITELQPFARDLRQTLVACRARTGFTPTVALLVGGGSRLRGMSSFLSEQLGIPAWRPSNDDVVALAGPRKAADAASLPIDSAALTIGMVYDGASGRPMFDLRSGQLAHKVDLSFLRAKAVPLGAAVLAVAAFAAGSAYADLYRLRKAEKVLSERLANETKEVFGAPKTLEELQGMTTGPVGGAAGILPKSSAYDILLEISQKVPAKDKIQLDIDEIEITDTKIDVSGYVKTSAQIDMLVTELKAIKCFKDVTRGATDTEGELKKFKLTINASCM